MSALFRDDTQRARVCKALTDAIRKPDIWDADGLTESGQTLWETKGYKAWSHGEQIVWGIVWAVWRGDDAVPASFSEIIYTLDEGLLRMVGKLVIALTDERMLDAWIAQYDRPWR